MSLNRRVGGALAKKRGDQFENFFESRCRSNGITCIGIPDGCRQLSFNRTIRVKTPFDYILGYGNKVLFCDLKSIDGKRITYSQLTDHQIESLDKLSHHAMAGYIVFFRELQKLVYFAVGTLNRIKRGESLGIEDGVVVGDLLRHDFRILFDSNIARVA